MDFGYGNGEGQTTNAASQTNQTNQNNNLQNVNSETNNQENENISELNNGNNSNNGGNNNSGNDNDNNNSSPSTGEDLAEGTIIEVDNNEYRIDANGNLLDKDNNIFKEKKDVKDFLASLENVTDENDSNINIDSIKKLLGVQVLDDKGNEVDFGNGNDSVEKYIAAATNNIKNEAAEIAMQTFFDKYPAMMDAFNYYVANGNSFEGFAETNNENFNIEIDENNVEQQKNIIRMVWKNQNRKGDVDAYIDFLKSQNTLYDVAKDELETMKAEAEEAKQYQAQEAQRIEEENRARELNYWNAVKNVIDKKVIAGYQIPDTILVNRDGNKVAKTPDDFFRYLYLVDDHGHSRYEYDLANQDPNTRLQNDILRAYLMFTGGDYSSLVNMAITKKEVQTYRTKANNQKKQTYKIKTPGSSSSSKGELDFGY